MNLIKINELSKDQELLLQKLQECKLISEQGAFKCLNCKGDLTLSKDSLRIDGWRCNCLKYVL